MIKSVKSAQKSLVRAARPIDKQCLQLYTEIKQLAFETANDTNKWLNLSPDPRFSWTAY